MFEVRRGVTSGAGVVGREYEERSWGRREDARVLLFELCASCAAVFSLGSFNTRCAPSTALAVCVADFSYHVFILNRASTNGHHVLTNKDSGVNGC